MSRFHPVIFQVTILIALCIVYNLTEVAGEGGPDLAPQNFLLFQKFRHLMRCKKYLENVFYFAQFLRYSCLFTFLILTKLCEIVVLMGATISQSFVKIGSETKNFYCQDIFCKQTADTLFQLSQKVLSQFCSKFSENVPLTQPVQNQLRNQDALNFLLISVSSCLFTKYIIGPSFVPVRDIEMLGPSTRLS